MQSNEIKRHTGFFTTVQLAAMWVALLAASRVEAQSIAKDDLAKQIQTYASLSQHADPPKMTPVAAGTIWSHLGTLYQEAGQYPQSEIAFQHALRLLKIQPVSWADLATAMDDMGTLYMAWGDTQQAETAGYKALEIRQEHALLSDLPRSWYHLATLSLRQKHAEKARDYAKRAVDQLSANQGSNPDDQINARFLFALSLCRLQRYAEALAAMQNAMKLAHRIYKPNEFPIAFGSFLLGYTYWKSGDIGTANDLMRDGAAQLERQLGYQHPVNICIMSQYAHFLHSTHQRAAEKAVEEKLKSARNTPVLVRGAQTLSVASLF